MLILILHPGSVLQAQQTPCAEQYFDIPLGDELASAGFFANFWRSEGSIRYALEHAFTRALAKIDFLRTPHNFCGESCKLSEMPYMFFHSVPLKVKTSYPDHDHCQELQKQTLSNPFRYTRTDLEDSEQLVEFIEDLARGSNREGSDLYERCDASCSPRYFYRIRRGSKTNSNYSVVVDVQCGHARDRSDDLYHLEYSFRWICEDISG